MSRDLYAVIGDPIEHSLSPAMQNAAFAAAGLHAEYHAEKVSSDDLCRQFPELSRSHAGLNVTIPHKEAVVGLVDGVDDIVRRLGAANTIRRRQGRVEATNTDPAGFRNALTSTGIDVDGAHALVFGTGGAARAVVHALVMMGAYVWVYGRSPERVDRLAALGAVPAYRVGLRAGVARADIVVNCTPLGMGDLAEESPLPPDAGVRAGTAVIDLVYGHETPFLRDAARQGAYVMDGLEMLICQGAESFRYWTGIDPDVELMRAACRRALEERTCCAS